MTEASGKPGTVAFIGLGKMGQPMAKRLLAAGYVVHGFDLSMAACDAITAAGGLIFDSAAAAVADSNEVILMLPDSKAVRTVVVGVNGIASAARPGSLFIDMSSSDPGDTRKLAHDLSPRNLSLIDAPVSGGVKRAVDGTLAIMVGGERALAERAWPLLAAMGKTIISTGPIGSGHAMKALNNFVSAAGLAAACEALAVASKFGIEPEVAIEVLNASTGRNNATENKMKQFVISGSFASGFSMQLMAKDLGIAARLADELGLDAAGIQSAARQWAAASQGLGPEADHTEIARVSSPQKVTDAQRDHSS